MTRARGHHGYLVVTHSWPTPLKTGPPAVLAQLLLVGLHPSVVDLENVLENDARYLSSTFRSNREAGALR